MAEMITGRRLARAPSNVYTVLVVIAFLMLASAVGYVWYRSHQLFGSQNPFEVPQGTTAGWVIPS